MIVHRVLRIIEYVGEPEFVEERLAARTLKGRVDFGEGKGYIQEAILGETAEILEYSALEASAAALLDRVTCSVCSGGKTSDPRHCRACGGSGWRDRSGPYSETEAELTAVSQMIVNGAKELYDESDQYNEQ